MEAIELTPKQLLKLAEAIHLQEVEKLYELKLDYEQQHKYLQGSKEAYDKTRNLVNDIQTMKDKAEAEKDDAKISIAHDIFQYSTTFISTSLQLIRSYDTRLTFMAKLSAHNTDLIKHLDSPTQIEEATRLANKAAMYKDYIVDYAKTLNPMLSENPKAEAPMAAGIGLARLIKHNYPNL